MGTVSSQFFGVVLVYVVTFALNTQVRAGVREGVVECTGEARILNGDRVMAKKTAIADGLRNCVEKVVGITIQSSFASTMKEVVNNNKSDFTASVNDNVLQKADGFVESYDVLGEEISNDVLTLRLKAKVFESKIEAEVMKLADLLAAAGNPKVMVAIQDIHISPQGERRVKTSVLGEHLQKLLLKRGIEIKGQSLAIKAARKEGTFQRIMSNPGTFGQAALKAGADVLIFGSVEIVDKGIIADSAFEALNGQTSIEITSLIKGVLLSTGEVFSSQPIQMKSIGIDYNRALHRALAGRGKHGNLVVRSFDAVFEDLKRSFRKTAKDGQRFEVRLDKVKSFRRQARSFIAMLGKLSGVSQVKQKSFAQGSLTLDLSCTCSAKQLQELIFSGADTLNGFSGLDVSGVTGSRLRFRL